MSVFKYEATRRRESVECPGVSFVLRRMTEGRRLDLRKKLAATNAKIRDILREQGRLLEVPATDQDVNRIMELQDEYDEAILTVVNPETIAWGVKSVEGLEVDNKPLGVEEWQEWPSHFFNEVLKAVNEESELNGAERKNSSLLGTFGTPEAPSQELTTAVTAEKSASI